MILAEIVHGKWTLTTWICGYVMNNECFMFFNEINECFFMKMTTGWDSTEQLKRRQKY